MGSVERSNGLKPCGANSQEAGLGNGHSYRLLSLRADTEIKANVDDTLDEIKRFMKPQ